MTDGHSFTFSGSGYVKYHLMENENKELMKLSLRLRTFSSHATVMYAKGTDYSILEVCVCTYYSWHNSIFIAFKTEMKTLLIVIKSRLTDPLQFVFELPPKHFHIRIKHITDPLSWDPPAMCANQLWWRVQKAVFNTCFTWGTMGMWWWLEKNHTHKLF